MGVIKMKHDLQEAIANGVKDYKGDYGSLLFYNDSKEYLQTLYYIEQLNIKIDGKRLLYHIKLDEEQLKTLSNEDIIQIKLCDILNKYRTTFLENLEEDDFISTGTFATKEKETKTKRATEIQLDVIKTIKKTLKNKFHINFEIEETESFLSLHTTVKELTLDKNMLKNLLAISKLLDMIAIVPYFDNDTDKIKGIRIFLAINLSI